MAGHGEKCHSFLARLIFFGCIACVGLLGNDALRSVAGVESSMPRIRRLEGYGLVVEVLDHVESSDEITPA